MADQGFWFAPKDWLLLLFHGAGKPVDRVRIQKAMFLFAQRSKASDHEKYEFEPYDYGPFSAAIYSDLARFEAADLIRREGSARSPAYSLTTIGREAAGRLAAAVPTERLSYLQQVRAWVLARSFNQLLTDVYDMYPDYAVRSVFRKP
jgi:hypothetical protein